MEALSLRGESLGQYTLRGISAAKKMQGLFQLVRVLVVHHQPDVVDVYANLLRHRGHVVRAACSAEEAIEIASGFKPHAAVCDVMLPGMSGVGLDLWFGEHQPDCRVLLVSTQMKAFQLVEESMRRGHSHTILPTPIEVAKIFEFVAGCKPGG